MGFMHLICALTFAFALTNVHADSPMAKEMQMDGGEMLDAKVMEGESRLESYIDATIMEVLQDSKTDVAETEHDAGAMDYDPSPKVGESDDSKEEDDSVEVKPVAKINRYREISRPGGLIHVTTSTNYLWGTTATYQIVRCNRPCRGSWVTVPGALKQVDASDDEVWGVQTSGAIFKRPVDGSGGWIRVPGALKHVSASGNGYIWGVNNADLIYKCKKPCTGGRGWINVPGRLKQIDGGERYVYGVNSANDVFTRPVDGSGSWRHIRGRKLKHVTASGALSIFGVDPANNVYSCAKPCNGSFRQLTGKLSQVDGAFDSFAGIVDVHQVLVHPIGL